VRSEGVGQPKLRGELRAEGARAENPHRDAEPLAGNRTYPLAGRGGLEIFDQLDDVARELLGIAGEVAPHRPSRGLIGPRRAPEAEIDAPGEQRFKGSELLGDLQRRMVGQHDPARADANRRGSARDMAQRHRRRRAGDARHRMMFGHPESFVAEPLSVAGEVAGIVERDARVRALRDRREVQYRIWDHRADMGGAAAIAMRGGATPSRSVGKSYFNRRESEGRVLFWELGR